MRMCGNHNHIEKPELRVVAYSYQSCSFHLTKMLISSIWPKCSYPAQRDSFCFEWVREVWSGALLQCNLSCDNALGTWVYNFTSLRDAITWGDVSLSCQGEGPGCVLWWPLQVMRSGRSLCSWKMGSVNKLGPPSNVSSSHTWWSFPVDWIQPLGN